MTVRMQIEELRAWTAPRRAIHGARECPFLLSCTFSEHASEAELEEVSGLVPDAGLREFWQNARSAELFKDQKFGQWGLKILSPSEMREETERQFLLRPNDLNAEDLVIGTFFGDSDILVMDASECNRGGCRVWVASPLDSREEWPKVADSFSGFLAIYRGAEGEKYWETNSGKEH
jgi:hypothetical protein